MAYADLDGNGGICRQTRHTFARWVSESTGSIIETQDALGHKQAATTRIYVQRVAVKKERHSAEILDRLDLAVSGIGSRGRVPTFQSP